MGGGQGPGPPLFLAIAGQSRPGLATVQLDSAGVIFAIIHI